MGFLRSVEADLHLLQLADRFNLRGTRMPLLCIDTSTSRSTRNCTISATLGCASGSPPSRLMLLVQRDELAERLENLIALHLIGHWSVAVAVSALEVAKP